MARTIVRPSSEAKRQAILSAASKVFFDVGYEAASIEGIAEYAGVSKVTIYNYFGGKPGLFSAAVDHECSNMKQQMQIDPSLPRRPIREQLETLGNAFHDFVSRDEIVRFDRRIAAESDRDPSIGDTFMDAGPRPVCVQMAGLIEAAADAGEIEVDDPMLAAEQFVSMCKGFGELERRFCGKSDPERDRERIAGAIDVFMKAYGRK
ncbi:MAG: TetR/AcrR family transcriptional regulator [Erythrobacter sp.]|nr:TetR/AcrR family transcriptional regulator [Erythrobacter sp.]NNC47642.1 TetR/AcrR family transcriptional regulator [Sphingomonas sp.]RZV50066.1 MAG: TetR/AcrR family transcriptional regulator [Sphingomonadaceae bacterium]